VDLRTKRPKRGSNNLGCGNSRKKKIRAAAKKITHTRFPEKYLGVVQSKTRATLETVFFHKRGQGKGGDGKSLNPRQLGNSCSESTGKGKKTRKPETGMVRKGLYQTNLEEGGEWRVPKQEKPAPGLLAKRERSLSERRKMGVGSTR